MHHPTDTIEHTTAFVRPVMEHWLERKIAQWVHHEGSLFFWGLFVCCVFGVFFVGVLGCFN